MQINCHLSILIQRSAEVYGDRRALMYRDYDLGKWCEISWNEFASKVCAVSRSLIALGVGVQENVAVFSQNKPECLYMDFGDFGVRAVTIPFYATASAAQVQYMINDAAVRYVFVGEQQQYDTAFSVISVCPSLEKIVIFDRSVRKHENDHLSIYFDEFLALGEADAAYAEEVAQRTAAASFDDIANILYTSGTTGNSKGVILLHANLHATFDYHMRVLKIGPDDIILNFLPFTHVFERGWATLCLTCGCTLAINLRPQDVQRSLQEVRPTCMSSVPRFWEKVYQGVLDKMEHSGSVQRALIKDALRVGGEYWEKYASRGIPAPWALRMRYKMYDRTIIRLLRQTLGLDHPNIFPTAGAAISPEVERFVHAAGLNMLAGYGLTETTASVSFDHSDKKVTMGSIGRVMPGIEVKIGDNDEILVRGATVTPGYYRKEAETRAVLDADGWFHTGDAGYFKDGELYMRERIKDLFKTSNGKYIAPQMIEGKLTIDRYIEQCVVVADQRKFVTALIVPSYPLLEAYAADHGIAVSDRAALCQHPDIVQYIKERIDTLQQDLAHYEQIKYFLLLPQPFTMESGELTNTLKIKRRVVYQHYAAEIDRLYEAATPKP